MDPSSNDDGPDSSSIRPVSSLLAKFENLNKTDVLSPSASRTASPVPGAPAPAPKPGRLRDVSPSTITGAREPPPVPPTRPKDRSSDRDASPSTVGAREAPPVPARPKDRLDNLSDRDPSPSGPSAREPPPIPVRPKDRLGDRDTSPSAQGPRDPPPVPARPKDRLSRDVSPSTQEPREAPSVPSNRPRDRLSIVNMPFPAHASPGPAPSPTRPVPPTPLSPRSVQAPPSFNIEPPQSPPKRGPSLATGDRPAFVSTDSLVKSTSPSSSTVSTANPFVVPSRPLTPAFEPRKSPRMPPSQPPSPPPPRRSAELRRDRELKELIAKPVPPPVNRAEKPLIGAARFSLFQPSKPKEASPSLPPPNDRVSPFSSPPRNSRERFSDDDAPPALPARPKAQLDKFKRASTFDVTVDSFEPPPIHPSLANRRAERDGLNGTSRSPATSHPANDQPPTLPARPQSMIETSRGAPVMQAPPPRPPRPGVNTMHHSELNGASATPQKRIVSTPTTQAPPPLIPRLNGNSVSAGHGGLPDRVPPTRTSLDLRPSPSVPATPTETRRSFDGPASGISRSETMTTITATYPDTSRVNRSKPYISKGVHEIATNYDSRVFDVCGAFVCTTGNYTRAWSLLDGELVMSFAMGEGLKGTSVIFRPGENVDEEGKRIWIGNNNGEILEADILSQSITNSRPGAHGRNEIIKMYRHYNELWTLDDAGTLHVWGPDDRYVPNLSLGPTQTYRVPKGHTFSMVVGDELWHATGKELRVFQPTLDGQTQFQVIMRPFILDNAGDVTAGTTLASDPDKIFFGHSDGKISIYSRKSYTCLEVLNVSQYKVTSLAGVGQYMWAGFNSGRMSVFDMNQSPWLLKKDWQAHKHPVLKLIADPASFYKLDRYQVVSLGADNTLRTWDGLLQDDWLEGEMKRRDTEYCTFEKIKALVLTWNAGASTPHSLRYSETDAVFIRDLLQSSGSPDIIVFGFQELVDLEDKTATAKRFLKPKKKEGSDQERMSHQYRDWRNFLAQSLDDYMSNSGLYHILHTAPLVGLFTCIFVKADLRERITNLSSAEVKRGMGGLHGNKGAVVVRFMVDDTSLCFINCHLAAGQGSANQRHNDIAAILEANLLPPERDPQKRIDSYVGGGDGSMILDHELCLLNGDLNYRIDTMSRDTVVAAVKAGNLAKLLERDQLLVARRRNPAFRLRAFEELPIAFAPTYKYDVGTDNYDTSEKRRSPAWCDRLLFRCGNGRGRIEQIDYRRHEVRVSDHRPVSGRFRFHVKKIDYKRRAVAWMECQQQWEDIKAAELEKGKLHYLMNVIGYDKATAQQIIKEREARKIHRSPSRHAG